jgi:hypothetical protein
MVGSALKVELLERDRHQVRKFRCGVEELDGWLRSHACDNQENGIARTYVLIARVEPPSGQQRRRVLGYYSLAPTSISLEDLPQDEQARLPRYPIPAVLLARLAIDRSLQEQRGVGTRLLGHAWKSICQGDDQLGGYGIVVDAISQRAEGFYQRQGFCRLPRCPGRLFMPMDRVRAAMADH